MNLDELRTVQAKERRKDSLQHLRDSFYEDVATYIEDLRAARDRRAGQVDNPFSDGEVRRMSDEIEAAEEVAEAVYERRVGKAVKLASFAAAEMPVETEGMTTQERALFDDLVARIEENKTTVLDILAGRHETQIPAPSNESDSEAPSAAAPDPGTPSTASPGTETADAADADGSDGGLLADAMGAGGPDGTDAAVDADAGTDGDDGGYTPVAPERSAGDGPPEAADASGPEPDAAELDSGATESVEAPAAPDALEAGAADSAAEEPTEEPAPAGDTDRTTVRIVQDVGAILGVDEREYTLAADDVVTLPSANAEPLLQRNAAERLE